MMSTPRASVASTAAQTRSPRETRTGANIGLMGGVCDCGSEDTPHGSEGGAYALRRRAMIGVRRSTTMSD